MDQMANLPSSSEKLQGVVQLKDCVRKFLMSPFIRYVIYIRCEPLELGFPFTKSEFEINRFFQQLGGSNTEVTYLLSSVEGTASIAKDVEGNMVCLDRSGMNQKLLEYIYRNAIDGLQGIGIHIPILKYKLAFLEPTYRPFLIVCVERQPFHEFWEVSCHEGDVRFKSIVESHDHLYDLMLARQLRGVRIEGKDSRVGVDVRD